MIKTLLVDDEKWTRETIKQFGKWQEYGIEAIEEAADGQEGLKLIEQWSPDIVITDMKMPGVDGMELLRIVAERFPQIKLIVASGYDDFHYMRQAIRSKANEYLLKPINANELNLTLEKCVKEIHHQSRQQLTPFSFLNKDISTLLMDYKKPIISFLDELNTEGFENAMERFFNELKEVDGIDNHALAKIEHEFILILEAQMIKNDCNVQEVYKNEELSYDSGLSLELIMKKHQDLGKRYVEYMLQVKKRKGRVDLQEIKEYIERNFTESHLSLDVLANKFFVSKEYLSKAFKAMYECNITEYIVSRRMEYAKKLIEANELQIKSIAQMAGYEDLSYFYRVFKKYFKISPGEMRQG
ncbi:response regulator [Neobacillus drentensis]|uniref:response regulator n=1 Tax=Neobacillus drentensis TaxID=220684 RepID=UPI001F3E49D6|nr:response regulator [Neobacillus drentensis]ULT58932.1 response regulator [Neobacillus drentensis]